MIIAAAVVLLPRSGYYLTLRNRDTGEVYARYKMGEGDRFSVTFIHSVNKYPLTDTYEIENKTIYVEETTYCSFGAGVQTELNPGETLDKVYVDRPDYKGWAMVIRNIHQDRTNERHRVPAPPRGRRPRRDEHGRVLRAAQAGRGQQGKEIIAYRFCIISI